MRSTGSWSISICPRFARLFAVPQKTTTRCPQLFLESSVQMRFVNRDRRLLQKRAVRRLWLITDPSVMGVGEPSGSEEAAKRCTLLNRTVGPTLIRKGDKHVPDEKT